MSTQSSQRSQEDTDCPCGRAVKYAHCCGRFHYGEAAPTAEDLMRSRYSAFVLENAEYLRHTWSEQHAPEVLEFDPQTKWLGLKIKSTKKGAESDNEGWVHFVARYKIDGKAHRIDENSYFLKVGGRWVYHSAQ